MRNVGGRNAGDHCRRALNATFTLNAAMQCSWRGTDSKLKLQDTRIVSAIKGSFCLFNYSLFILEAIKSNSRFSTLTDVEMKEFVKEWAHNAGRKGGKSSEQLPADVRILIIIHKYISIEIRNFMATTSIIFLFQEIQHENDNNDG